MLVKGRHKTRPKVVFRKREHPSFKLRGMLVCDLCVLDIEGKPVDIDAEPSVDFPVELSLYELIED
jgi:hypothetical protein